LPAISAEAMQNMIPILQKYTSSMQQRLQEQVAQMLQQSAPQAAKNPPATAN
jgi:Mlc titration factor MtfA (ptsG expression regulator)